MAYLLFLFSGTPADRFAATLIEAPWQLFVIVLAIVTANNLAGALRWQAAIRWLEPGAKDQNLFFCLQATVIGALFGLLVPQHLSVAAVRWVAVKRNGNKAGWAVRSTLYEQMFDVLVLIAAATGGLVSLSFALSGFAAASLIGAALVIALLLSHSAFRLAAWVISRIPFGLVSSSIHGEVQRFSSSLERAAQMPPSNTMTLFAYSVVRLLLQMAYGIAIASVFAPLALWHLVAAGIPVSALALLVPLTPSGLGIVDWTWSELLILAGATRSSAADAALSSRIIYSVALVVISFFLLLVGAAVSYSRSRKEQPSKQSTGR